MSKYYYRIWTSDEVQDILYKLEAEFGCPPVYKGSIITVEPEGKKVFTATLICPGLHAVRIQKRILNRV